MRLAQCNSPRRPLPRCSHRSGSRTESIKRDDTLGPWRLSMLHLRQSRPLEAQLSASEGAISSPQALRALRRCPWMRMRSHGALAPNHRPQVSADLAMMRITSYSRPVPKRTLIARVSQPIQALAVPSNASPEPLSFAGAATDSSLPAAAPSHASSCSLPSPASSPSAASAPPASAAVLVHSSPASSFYPGYPPWFPAYYGAPYGPATAPPWTASSSPPITSQGAAPQPEVISRTTASWTSPQSGWAPYYPPPPGYGFPPSSAFGGAHSSWTTPASST